MVDQVGNEGDSNAANALGNILTNNEMGLIRQHNRNTVIAAFHQKLNSGDAAESARFIYTMTKQGHGDLMRVLVSTRTYGKSPPNLDLDRKQAIMTHIFDASANDSDASHCAHAMSGLLFKSNKTKGDTQFDQALVNSLRKGAPKERAILVRSMIRGLEDGLITSDDLMNSFPDIDSIDGLIQACNAKDPLVEDVAAQVTTGESGTAFDLHGVPKQDYQKLVCYIAREHKRNATLDQDSVKYNKEQSSTFNSSIKQNLNSYDPQLKYNVLNSISEPTAVSDTSDTTSLSEIDDGLNLSPEGADQNQDIILSDVDTMAIRRHQANRMIRQQLQKNNLFQKEDVEMVHKRLLKEAPTYDKYSFLDAGVHIDEATSKQIFDDLKLDGVIRESGGIKSGSEYFKDQVSKGGQAGAGAVAGVYVGAGMAGGGVDGIGSNSGLFSSGNGISFFKSR